MRQTLVLDVVGLTPGHLGEHTPHLSALAREGAVRPLATIEPAVTCSVQSTFRFSRDARPFVSAKTNAS